MYAGRLAWSCFVCCNLAGMVIYSLIACVSFTNQVSVPYMWLNMKTISETH